MPETTTSSSSSSSSSGTGAGGSGGDADGGAGGESASGGAAPVGLGYENGTRLRARVFNGTDGSKQFIGWHDTEIFADCAFARTPGGTYRCLPTETAYSLGLYFSDPACTDEVVIATCAPKYVSRTLPGCDGGTIVSAVGPVAANLFLKSGANCISYPVPAGNTAYLIGADLPTSTFVEATVEVD